MRSPSPCLPACAAIAWAIAPLLATAMPAAGEADPDLAREPSWAIPSAEAVRERAFDWLTATAADRPPSAGPAARARAAWDAVASGDSDRLDAAMETIAAGDARAEAARSASAATDAPSLDWLDEPATLPFARDTVRLWWGRELVRHDRFDEALPLLADLDVAASPDPATLLFHRAACEHWLLSVEPAIATLDRLLEREADIPVRYSRVARLLRADLAALEDESLDHIARRMKDVTRRLAHGRAGRETRDVQDGVIASLDKLIEKIEEDQEKQDQSQGGGGGGGGSGQGGAGRPMEESRIAGGRGAGEVQKRELGTGEGWGNLPPHDRERALQQIGREFPPHYREAIEQYFKRLATGGEDRRP
jgi:hypothetical protein